MDEDVTVVSPSSSSKRRVAYYYDNDVGLYSYGGAHPMKPYRMRMTHHLVAAYDMLQQMDIFRPRRASTLDMTRFHTDEYIDFLSKVSPETAEELTGNGTRCEDNPAWDGLFEFCSISAGGSISAAQRLNAGAADIAINWAGGLHHAKKREASGFCYVNDIVLGILELLRHHPRWYGPRYRLDVESSNMQNDNDSVYLEGIKRKVLEGLRDLPFAPSVGIQEVPRMDVGEAIGLAPDEEGDDASDMDEIDLRLSHHVRNAHTVQSSSSSSSGDEQSYSSGGEDGGIDGGRDRRGRPGHTSNRHPPKRVFFRRQGELLWDAQDGRPGMRRGGGPAIWNEDDSEIVQAHEASFIDLGMGRKKRYTVGIMASWKPDAGESP
ncbi:hypothetical protein FRC07_004778 [Ceratobasidium sp. 392]|nr:hypothetical protein FRC07_004778 [Ceratobasidium sp. 392]